jgi:hypothetical protein
LDVWAAASSLGPAARALALLTTLHPDVDPSALASLSIGQRDRGLLELRERLFGPTLEAGVDCPACGAKLELEVDASGLGGDSVDRDQGTQWSAEVLTLESYAVRFRLPNSRDLAAVEGRGDVSTIRGRLLDSCLAVEAGQDGVVPSISDEAARALGLRMAEVDPFAALEVEVDCPECGERWPAPLNLAEFLWSEVDAWARRTLHQVHLLATAYSWTEQQVLIMHPAKRARYLQMVAG